jgi:succinoglycan biosynthesis protein ExoA
MTAAASMTRLSVAVIVPIRNERARLPGLLAGIERQTLRPRLVVFADGQSDDGSRGWLDRAQRTRPWLRVVDNPERIIPTALNRAVEVVDSDIVARMDAHVDYEDHYLESLVSVLEAHPALAGAGAPYATAGRGAWGAAIAAVLRRPWGHGGAQHTIGSTPGPVTHTRWTAYRTAVVKLAGGWDVQMLVNEDEEMDVRVRDVGQIWLVPTTRSTWFVRDSGRGLARQMWRYGFYRAVTVRLHPETLQARVLAPPALVTTLTLSALTRPRTGLRAVLGYLTVAGALGAYSAQRDGASWWRGALSLPVVHLVYGTGFIVGWVTRNNVVPQLDAGRLPDRWRESEQADDTERAV